MIELIKQTFQEWQQDNVPSLAAAVAYYAMFSVAPLLIIVIAVLAFFGHGDAQATILEQVRGVAGGDAADLVGTMIQNRQASGGNVLATAVGVVLVLVGATGVVAQLQLALNTIWGVRADPERSGLRRIVRVRLLSLMLILAIGLLVLAAIVAGALLRAAIAAARDQVPQVAFLWSVLDPLVSVAVALLLFALVFKILPDVLVPWRAVWLGALVSAVLFVGGNWLLGFYFSRGAVAGAYGAAGSLVVVLLWVYFSAQILLLGAEITQVYARRSGEAIEPDAHAVRAAPAGPKAGSEAG